MGLSTSRDLRCPRCDAHVRADADWCTLCYADLRPAPEPAAEPVAAPVPEPVALEPPEPAGQPPAEAAAAPVSAGKHARHRATDDPPAGLEGVDVEAMLAQLALESDSGLGPLAGRLQTKESKALVIVGGIAVVCVVVFALMAALGALL